MDIGALDFTAVVPSRFRPKGRKTVRLPIEALCEHCGAMFRPIRTGTDKRSRFCSVSCAKKTRYGVSDDRLPRIIAMREAGQTNDEIGAVFGVTGERVRQLLAKCRRDLIGRRSSRVFRASPHYTPPARPACEACGQPVHSYGTRYCSNRCASAVIRESNMARYRAAYEARLNGATWTEVASVLGRRASVNAAGGAQIAVERWATRNGLPIAPLKGWRKHNGVIRPFGHYATEKASAA